MITRLECEADRTWVQVRGEVDLNNVEHVQAEVLAAAKGHRRLVLDLSEIEFFDSQGLRLLERLSRMVGGTGTDLVVLAPLGCIVRVLLEITAMDEELNVISSASDAR